RLGRRRGPHTDLSGFYFLFGDLQVAEPYAAYGGDEGVLHTAVCDSVGIVRISLDLLYGSLAGKIECFLLGHHEGFVIVLAVTRRSLDIASICRRKCLWRRERGVVQASSDHHRADHECPLPLSHAHLPAFA